MGLGRIGQSGPADALHNLPDAGRQISHILGRNENRPDLWGAGVGRHHAQEFRTPSLDIESRSEAREKAKAAAPQ